MVVMMGSVAAMSSEYPTMGGLLQPKDRTQALKHGGKRLLERPEREIKGEGPRLGGYGVKTIV